MAVDAAHQHIFFSQGNGSTGILVTDLSGTPITTIADEPGATGLALSADGGTLYAALADGDVIAAIDTATLTESARYPTGTDRIGLRSRVRPDRRAAVRPGLLVR